MEAKLPVRQRLITIPKHQQHHADDTVAEVVQGQKGAARGLGDEGGQDQRHHNAHHEVGGNVVRDLGLVGEGQRIGLLAEEEQEDQHGQSRAQLHRPEDTGTAAEPEEVKEVHLGIAAQQDGGGVAHQGGRTLQVGGDRDGDDGGNGGHILLLAHRQSDGGDHQNRGHVVHEGRHHARKHCHGHDGHLDVLELGQHHVSDAHGHLGLDEQGHDAHGARDHHEDIEVDGTHDGTETELNVSAEEGQPHREDHRRAEGYVGARLGQGEEEDVGDGEEDDGYEEGGHGFAPFNFKLKQFVVEIPTNGPEMLS